jgi:hypothetical protein
VRHSTGTGLATMTINNLKACFNTADADAITSTLSSTGTDSFAGGTLNIGATKSQECILVPLMLL